MTRLGEDRITEIFGTPEEMHENLERGWRDVHFLWDNIERWRELHLDKWIAVHDEAVVAVADDLDSLIDDLRSRRMNLGEVLLQPIRATYSNIVPSSFGLVKE